MDQREELAEQRLLAGVRPITVDGSKDLVIRDAPLLALKYEHYQCGVCAHVLAHTHWEIGAAMIKRGSRHLHCLNSSCSQFKRIMNVPLNFIYCEEVK